MSGNGTKVISTKITDSAYEKIEAYANGQNVSVSAMLKLFMSSLLSGEIGIDKGELKTEVDPIGYAVSAEEELTLEHYKDLNLDRLADTFEKYGYPDSIVRQQVEGIIAQIKENGRYNSRRSSNDYGC